MFLNRYTFTRGANDNYGQIYDARDDATIFPLKCAGGYDSGNKRVVLIDEGGITYSISLNEINYAGSSPAIPNTGDAGDVCFFLNQNFFFDIDNGGGGGGPSDPVIDLNDLGYYQAKINNLGSFIGTEEWVQFQLEGGVTTYGYDPYIALSGNNDPKRANRVFGLNFGHYFLMRVPESISFTKVSTLVYPDDGTTDTVALGIYNSNANFFPGDLLYDLGETSGGNGAVEFNVTGTLGTGYYWIALSTTNQISNSPLVGAPFYDFYKIGRWNNTPYSYIGYAGPSQYPFPATAPAVQAAYPAFGYLPVLFFS